MRPNNPLNQTAATTVVVMFLFLSGCLGLVLTEKAYGQKFTAKIVGTITDSTGAVVPKVTVTATQVSTNLSWSQTTDDQGRYAFVDLPTGKFILTASLQGFKTTETEIVLEVDQNVSENLILQVGSVSQRVAVTGTAPLLVTQSSSVGQEIENRTVDDLPLNGRNYMELETLGPGVGGGSEPAFNGADPSKTEYYADGGSIRSRNMCPSEVNQLAFDEFYTASPLRPIIDSIQEFKIESGAMSAEFTGSGTVINVVTKSGTNQIHGSGWEFVRNNDFDARNFFEATVSPRKQNQFGGTIGGPILKNRLFGFFAYEGNRIHNGEDFDEPVPSAAMDEGNFSGLAPIYDPATRRPDPNNPAEYTATQFPNNIIPLARQAQPALFFEDYWNLPNAPGNTFATSRVGPDDYDQYDVRIDVRLSDKDQAYGRWNRSFVNMITPFAFSKIPINQDTIDAPEQFVVGYTHTFTPHILGEGTFNVFHTRLAYTNPLTGTEYFTQAGISGFQTIQTEPDWRGFPRINVSGEGLLDSGLGDPVLQPVQNWQLRGKITYIKGAHILKFGLDTRHDELKSTFTERTHGDFGFNGQYTEEPESPAGTGSGFADYMLGLPDYGRRAGALNTYGDVWNSAQLWVQDDWKIKPHLTFNMGIRYEYDPPPHNDTYADSNFDFGEIPQYTGDIIVSTVGGDCQINLAAQAMAATIYNLFSNYIVTNCQAGLPRSLAFYNYKDIAPRVGFAWQPLGNKKTVIRGGYGIFYNEGNSNSETHDITSPPWIFTDYPSNNIPIPNRTWANYWLGAPFPSIVSPPGVSSANFHLRTPYIEQWNLAIQRSLAPNTTIQIAYVGTGGRFLDSAYTDNSPVTPGPGTLQSRLPFPVFNEGIQYNHNGVSDYNSLQVSAERRWSSGLSFLGSYTWAKNLTDDSEYGVGIQNPYNVRASRGQADFNLTNRGVLSVLYELPAPKVNSRVARHLLEHWELGNIFVLQSGFPFTASSGIDTANVGYASNANCIGPVTYPKSLTQWFSLSAFAVPASYTYGSCGSNTLTGPSLLNLDTSVLKKVSLTEKVTAQFRFEFFNMLNHPNFMTPDGDITDGTTGEIFGANDPRLIQFALKLEF